MLTNSRKAPMSRRFFLKTGSATLAAAAAIISADSAFAALQPSAADGAKGAAVRLLALFRTPMTDPAQRLKGIVESMDSSMETGAALAAYQGGSMVVAYKPMHATSRSRVAQQIVQSLRNGAQLAALVEERAVSDTDKAEDADKAALARLDISAKSSIKIVQNDGASNWRIAVALAPGSKVTGPVVTATKTRAGGWSIAS